MYIKEKKIIKCSDFACVLGLSLYFLVQKYVFVIGAKKGVMVMLLEK